MISEEELLVRAQSYDRTAIGELYDRYAEKIYGYLYKRVGNAQVAEDLTGDVFVKVLEAIEQQRSWKISFRAWLYRIAHNVVVDYYRSRKSDIQEQIDEQTESPVENPGNVVAEAWSHQELRIALRQLTEDQQQVLILRFSEEMKSREVAEILGKSTGAVEALQYRALASLKRILDEQMA
jgi:RNA polymerase sigma-70 factor (ECF subfamily)